MTTKRQIIKWIHTHKSAIGFGNYSCTIKFINKDLEDDNKATIVVDEYAQNLEITFGKEFLESNDIEQKNIMIHELVHGRMALMRSRIGRYTAEILQDCEEICVNDITSLIEEVENE